MAFYTIQKGYETDSDSDSFIFSAAFFIKIIPFAGFCGKAIY